VNVFIFLDVTTNLCMPAFRGDAVQGQRHCCLPVDERVTGVDGSCQLQVHSKLPRAGDMNRGTHYSASLARQCSCNLLGGSSTVSHN
jgi:hypothetical protein